MYKVVLVDDEYLTRDAISKNTPWEEAGFELVGTAENGEAAIDVLEREQPDLVLTDICMPKMDGIALSGYIHEHFPEMKVIIISGYDDFEYAKQALKYEVSDYILKPITSYELVEELEKIGKKISEGRMKKNQVEKIQQEYEKNIPTLRSHFLNRLLEGNYLKNDISAQMEQFQLQSIKEVQAVMIIELEDADGFRAEYPNVSDDLVDFSIANISEEIVHEDESVIFVQNTENQSICIISAENDVLLQEKIEKYGMQIIEMLYKYMKINVCLLVGENVTTPQQWCKSYVSALNARDHKFLLEEHAFVYGKDFSTSGQGEQIQTSQWIDALVLQIKLNQKKELCDTVTEMFKAFRDSGKEKKNILLHVQNVVLSIMINLEDAASESGYDIEEIDFVHRMTEYKHLTDVEKRFMEFVKKLSDEIDGKRESANQKQAVLALDYIDKNYMNVNMSLNMVCAHLCVSTSYFSTIFKNATGETFVEALTRVRMEKAKMLLETSNMKSYEVAFNVGYNDPHYFSSIFKKHMGITPTEYAKRLRK